MTIPAKRRTALLMPLNSTYTCIREEDIYRGVAIYSQFGGMPEEDANEGRRALAIFNMAMMWVLSSPRAEHSLYPDISFIPHVDLLRKGAYSLLCGGCSSLVICNEDLRAELSLTSLSVAGTLIYHEVIGKCGVPGLILPACM